MKQAFFVLTIVAAIGRGLIGGVFFAFSTFVMQGLGRIHIFLRALRKAQRSEMNVSVRRAFQLPTNRRLWGARSF
jgi:uncharacterized membrane protein